MPISRSWTLLQSAALLTVGAFLAPACGGSAEFTAAQAGAAGSSVGGNGGDGGGGGRDCPRSCPALACGPGFESVLQVGDCCPSCVPDGSGGSGGGNPCANVNCPAIDCASGYEYQSTPDQCCGSCVPDDAACSKGQAAYRSLRKALLADPSALECSQNADCKLLTPNPSCGDQCATVPVSAPAAISIGQQLSQFADANCSTCTVIYPPCALPPPPICIGGQCVLGGYL